ncbi:MAG: CpXC domain-containing protein [Rectinemataceae bacterium]
MRKVTCMCETTFEADLPEEVDLDASPDVMDEILRGDFLAVTCPNCGARLKPELRVRLVSKKTGIDIVALPELERVSLYRGAVELPKSAQAVVGYPELFERARILVDGLDPEAVEIIKYWLIQKAAEQAPEADIVVAYAGKKDDKLAFHLTGLKEGHVAVLPVEMGTYAKTLSEKARSIREAPFDRIFNGHYRSIRIIEADAEN